ncbi:protein CMSS1 isoform X2 [Eucyclogobius newberryi]|uniref:protein CMSS1 isoform X2 n=1 Tax=Eucyclogobius newberryi TaxID=166745 RepID=UPI003B5BE32C
MGDDLGDEWWTKEGNSGDCEAEANEEIDQPTDKKPITINKKLEKRKRGTEKDANPKKKKNNEQKAPAVSEQKEPDPDQSTKVKKKRKKKKTITDVLAAVEPKPGCPADLQSEVTKFFKDKLSVIEQEEFQLKDSSFLTCNDLTHSLSSYLKQICPKWAKLQKHHTEKSSAVILIVCSSALRTIELIKQLTTFKGEAKVLKLFAKHIKIEEQVKLLQKGITHIGVGTPGRISALIEQEGLHLQSLRYVVLDWNWRDQKLRRMVDIPEIKLDFMNLLEKFLRNCKEFKIGLF